MLIKSSSRSENNSNIRITRRVKMKYENNSKRINRQLLIETARLVSEDRLIEDIDRVPLNMFPKNSNSVRCCIHKDRAIVKYRLMAILGHRVEDEKDELKPLHDYAAEALEREKIEKPILTVIDEGCTSCLKGRHFVTNVCKGCVARPCAVNCPKDAIQIVNNQARIDEEKCVNCGLCLKACPYHAIVYIPIPCEEACPVNAISKDENGNEKIDYSKCTFCGQCMQACPFGAVMERSQIVDVITQLKGGKNVTAMFAPSMAGQFPDEFRKVAAAAKKLGFEEVVEVALGADVTIRKEAQELSEKIEKGQELMTTSCCPAYVQTVQKHIPEMEKFISQTKSPMHYTAELVKKDDPEAVTVFIGPCVAKRQEAINDDAVDYVLTTEEFGAMLVASEIEISQCQPMEFKKPAGAKARGFAVSGGVAEAVIDAVGNNTDIKHKALDGLDKRTINLLKNYAKGKFDEQFLEVMGCENGCVGGPCNLGKSGTAAKRVEKFIRNADKTKTG